MTGPNEYYVAIDKVRFTRWDLFSPTQHPYLEQCRYHAETLRELDTMLGPRGLKFCMIWHLDELPLRGEDVVVLLIGDERYQLPSYSRDVLAVFRTGAGAPFHPYRGTRAPIGLKLVDEVRSLRDLGLRVRRSRSVDRAAANIHSIPLGFHNQVDVPFVPFGERPLDVFFAGGRGAVPRLMAPTTWSFRPRVLARSAMIHAIDTLTVEHPDVRVELVEGTNGLGPAEYSTKLMSSRISLCPRGNFPETFRHLESARAGCVVITEPLPREWYHLDFPALTLTDWRDAPTLISQLIADPERANELHRRTLQWWKDVASPAALARFMALKLDDHVRASS